MIQILIGLIHISISLFICYYIFIIPKNLYYDFSYIIINILQIILIIIHNNTCPISYYYNKYTNNQLNINNSDVSIIIDVNQPISKIIEYISLIINFISIYYASVRSKILTPLLSLLLIVIRILFIIYRLI